MSLRINLNRIFIYDFTGLKCRRKNQCMVRLLGVYGLEYIYLFRMVFTYRFIMYIYLSDDDK